MPRIISVFKRLLFVACAAAPILLVAQGVFPTPPRTPQRLFYIQRTGNTNTIVYDANTIDQGRAFNNKNPILVYWLRYDEQGQVMPLNYLQRTLAYGVEVTPSERPGEYEFHIVSYPKGKLRLLLDRYRQPRVEMPINGHEAWLERVFVKIEGKKVGIIPDVKYVELFGTDVQTGKPVYEKFIP
ncbi:MAG: DUF4833 domain-containing protein [Bacteroidetes bacterium]|nr:MAG: DUF4833 domain-containing protein [Bacteroidota bacterium]